ncbi:hypothetical protein EN935_17640 [Mesorhizobium sp. M7D.F.Ca.US.004.03.1.1]|jgi:hypothetical protein|uniref:hypothetical protein n=1 Tax=Mesorhizobium sp. M7D.F.Ca.US.004.03.1.1 TaxID=2496702 RepID=UPI000D6C61EB|nr:hypothetical protein [Mesorhizobium sp. M7D.F.Ca.US.004.03.1.1]RVA28961.1 hypothetical protein EN935_17640 [Mesorhizobium sp. M7D.F.Ca.US.004.03.1.1]
MIGAAMFVGATPVSFAKSGFRQRGRIFRKTDSMTPSPGDISRTALPADKQLMCGRVGDL